ncbi:uracil-DNA glycosylase family protein [Bacillus gobiensis]|uniref:uracil-DNA glycosylase family protein n=1 Tax=Bacillus gobiensis TaxID=1441095 RepID=UPI003D263F10
MITPSEKETFLSEVGSNIQQKSKQESYKELVAQRKRCFLCEGVENPSKINNGEYDSDFINPWSKWKSNLNAKVMVIGQDWGNVKHFVKNKGTVDNNNNTNKRLLTYLELIEVDQEDTYFTNTIKCMKQSNDMSGKINSKWITNCGEIFLKKEIEIVSPDIILVLGKKAFDVICKLYSIKKCRNLGIAINKSNPFIINNKIKVFPLYHLSTRVVNRSVAQQEQDWMRIKQHL